MKARRIASLLVAASVAAMGLLVGTAQPAAASNCDITGPDGAHGQYVCGTNVQIINWVNNVGTPIGKEIVVVGTNFRVYHDFGHGWSILNGGAVLPTASPSAMGVFDLASIRFGESYYRDVIQVFGTTGHYFCSRSTGPNGWDAWTTASCPHS